MKLPHGHLMIGKAGICFRSAAQRAVADGSFQGLRHVGTGGYRSQTMRGRLY
jgi:hypothetical protein